MEELTSSDRIFSFDATEISNLLMNFLFYLVMKNKTFNIFGLSKV